MYRELEKTEFDTKSKLISAIASEYVSKLKAKTEKSPKKSKHAQASLALSEKITFADITVWFYKKNCPQSLEEAKSIWEILPETIIQKQEVTNYFQVYAERILEKHSQYVHYSSQCKKLETLISQTTNFTREIRSLLPQLDNSFENESNSSIPENFTFEIVLASIDDQGLESQFQRSDLLGHQIEFLCSETNMKSSMTQTVGSKIKFHQEKITLQFDPKNESLELNLCEIYGCGNEVAESRCIARRNLDLFTNINEWYIREILEYAQVDPKQLDCDDKLEETEFESLKERWENSRKFESFLLKKQNISESTIRSKRKKVLKKSSLDQQLIQLNMSIEIPTINSVQDFQSYLALCDLRADYLREKLRNARAQALINKRSISLLLAPFENVKFDEKTIFFEEAPKKTPKHDCKIF